jgi:ABC-type branched-subunit amino acid transport system permease subunit
MLAGSGRERSRPARSPSIEAVQRQSGKAIRVVRVCINDYMSTMSRSASGRVPRAIQKNQTAAESLGKRASRFRLQAFVIGCMLMGPVGPLYVHFAAYIAQEDFLPILAFQCRRC